MSLISMSLRKLKVGSIFGVSFACAVLAVLFYGNPQWDLIVSALFYRSGEGFFLGNHPLVLAAYWFFRYIHFLLLAVLVAMLLASWWRPYWRAHRRRLVYALLVLLLGPGLLVHNLFKDHWDRARPRELIEFQGSRHHSPAFVISDQCQRNCSFVSGHAAIAFYFMIIGFIGRKRWLWLGLVVGVVGGVGRIAQGGHFLSDVLFAGFLVYFTCWFLAKWMNITPAFDELSKR